MFNQNDLRMAKAQQERLVAEATKRDGRGRRSEGFAGLVRRLGVFLAGGRRRAEKRTAVGLRYVDDSQMFTRLRNGTGGCYDQLK